MIREMNIPMFQLIMCLSESMDLISPALVNHHKQVAYIASRLGEAFALPREEQDELVLAGALHDVGALSLKEKLGALKFEVENAHLHCEAGYLLLRLFGPFSKVATLVRFHHAPWKEQTGAGFAGHAVPLGSHVLNLADRVAAAVSKREEVLGQVDRICNKVKEHSGEMFMPELVEAFLDLARKEYFWLDIVSSSISTILGRRVRRQVELDLNRLLDLARVFSHIIDFRNRFTATHSSGVAVTAKTLAGLVGFSERQGRMMEVAGYLHDLGKLSVPPEILEKPAQLTREEFNIVRGHTYHTYRALEALPDFEVINSWASFHHERLNGQGYPFRHKGEDLPLGSRIMAVADVFTAITEDRPYRAGMAGERALKVLQQMAENSVLDASLVSLVKVNFDEINSLRLAAQEAATREYEQFLQR